MSGGRASLLKQLCKCDLAQLRRKLLRQEVAESHRSSRFSTLTLGSHAGFGRRVFQRPYVLGTAAQEAQSLARGPLARQWLTWPGQLRGGFWPEQHILLIRVYIVCAWPRGAPGASRQELRMLLPDSSSREIARKGAFAFISPCQDYGGGPKVWGMRSRAWREEGRSAARPRREWGGC